MQEGRFSFRVARLSIPEKAKAAAPGSRPGISRDQARERKPGGLWLDRAVARNLETETAAESVTVSSLELLADGADY